MPPPPTRPTGVAEAIAMVMSETPLRDPPYVYYSSRTDQTARAVREIQEDEDRRILELLQRPPGLLPLEQHTTSAASYVSDLEVSLQRIRLDWETFQEAFNQINRQALRATAPIFSRREYEDILALYDQPEHRRILPVTVPRDFVEDGILPGDQLQVDGLPGTFTVQERVGMAVINPRGVSRIQFPEFEILSSPSIDISEIRSRRFNVIDRGGYLEPAVQRILDAVIRAKSAPEPKPFRQSSGSARSVWEALVDLDLVDVSSS